MASFKDWTRRMGQHEAYHLNSFNRILHWTLIPLEILGVIRFLGAFLSFSTYYGTSIDLGLIVILLSTPIYMLTEPLIGFSFSIFLIALWSMGPALSAIGGIIVFILALTIQTQVGHAMESKGRDDTSINIKEFQQTKDFIPLLLIFYYHWVELWFLVGYRRDLHDVVIAERERVRLSFRQ